jgi:molecular chaperone GrpE
MQDNIQDMEHKKGTDRQDAPDGPADAEPEEGRTSADEGAGDLDLARSEAAEWRDKFVRKLAEFDNYRKRTRQELDLMRQMAAESMLYDLLPVLDDFDRMLATGADSDDPYRKGAELIRDKLWNFLKAQGVERMEALGKPFDPMQHDALIMQPMQGFPPHTVLNVVTPGYRIGDRVLRHAQVVVSAEPELESPGDDGPSSEGTGQ